MIDRSLDATDNFPSSEGKLGADKNQRLSASQKSLYAFGDVADAVKNVALSQFLLYYLTVAVGLSGSVAGAILFVTLVVDAITDPVFGYLSDNTRSRYGRRHPFMFASALPFAVSLGLLFSVPAFESSGMRIAYVLTTLLGLRISFSAFILPYAAMSAELSSDYKERSVIMAYRIFFNNFANIAIITLGFGVFFAGSNALETRSAYVPFGWTCALLVLIAALVSATSTLGLRSRLQSVAVEPRAPFFHIFTELREVFANGSFRVLAMTAVVFWVAQGTQGALAVHAFRHFWQIDPATIRNVLYALVVGSLIGIPLVGVLLQRYEKKTICATGIAIFCIGQLVPSTMMLLGWIPKSVEWVFPVLASFYFILGMATASVAITFSSMMADATDEHEFIFGTRREGLYFSGLTFSGKCAIGLGAFVAGLALDLIAFPRDLAINPEQEIAYETVRNLGIVYGPGAAIISLLSVLCMVRYKLSSTRHAEIQAQLTTRNTGAI